MKDQVLTGETAKAPRVLVVDDSRPSRDALAAVVRASGFQLAGVAASGEEALALLPRARPDLALVDVRLPGLDGYETADAIRRTSPDLVVVLLSADSHATVRFDVVAKGMLTPDMLRRLWKRGGAGLEG